MNSALAQWQRGERGQVLWIDFERYAWRVFAGATAEWYQDPVRFAGTIGQALRVVRSDVVAIDVLAPFIAAWRAEAAHEQAPVSVSALTDFLSQQPACLSFISEVADALQHSVGDRADLALKLFSPRDLLLAVGADEALASDFSALDDLGAALVELLRNLSSKSFACLQLHTLAPAGLSADEQDAYAPILRTAEYYGWITCLSFGGVHADMLPDCEAAIALYPEVAAEDLVDTAERRCGGGLTSRFWLGPDPLAGELGLLHGTIPADAYPEAVAEKIRSLGR